MKPFTVEEITIMSLYHTSSKAALLADLNAAIPHVDDPDVLDCMYSCIRTLEDISEAAFSKINFSLELF